METGNIITFTSGKKIFYGQEYLVDGEFLFLNDGGQFDINYYNGKANYSDHVFTFTTKKEQIMIKFLYYYLLNINHLINEKYFRGGGIRNLIKSAFMKLVVPLPPMEIQNEIVRILDRFDTYCHDLTCGLPGEIKARHQQYIYYRDLLLNFKKKED